MKNKSGTLPVFLLAVLSGVLLSGCGWRADMAKRQDPQKLRIVTTVFPPYDFARQIGGDAAETVLLLKPGMESHSYEPTPADIVTIMNSDIFLYAGGESDVWVEELLKGTGGGVESHALLDWVDPLEEETVAGMQVKGHDHGQEEGTEAHAVHLEGKEYDEHVWTSPQNAMVIVEKLCGVMCQKDREHAELFAQNAAAYTKKLSELDAAFREVTRQENPKPLVFGDRFPLLYFVRTYGLEYYAAFPGCSMETEPSAAMVAFLTDEVKKEGIPVVFYLEMSNGKVAEAIAEAAGARTAVFYSGHSITAKDLEAGEDYLSLMYRNVETLREFYAKEG